MRHHLSALSLRERAVASLNRLQEDEADEQHAVALEEAIETHGDVQWVSNLVEIKLTGINVSALPAVDPATQPTLSPSGL